MTITLIRGELGYNTFYIKNHLPELNIITRDQPLPTFTGEDIVIRWGTARAVPNGPMMLNRRKAMAETSNKGIFRKKVADAGFAPKTWTNVHEWAYHALEHGLNQVIVRPLEHQRSENLHSCKTLDEVRLAVEACGPSYYISEYIKKDKEFRVFIAQGRPFIVAEKRPPNKEAVSWGCVDAGVFDYVAWEDWPESVVRCATEAFNLSKLDFAAVDIIYKDGEAYFLEANTAPEILNYYGQSFAKIFKYIKDNGRDRIPVAGWDNWKKIIHPAMSNKAIIQQVEAVNG